MMGRTEFAPNPFVGYWMLACYKPGVRKHAKLAITL